MGYRIVYGPGTPNQKPTGSFGRLKLMTAGCFLFGVILTHLFWPEGTALLREALIPGEKSATEQAFGILVEDLRQGEQVTEAVTAFCRYVIEHGEEN